MLITLDVFWVGSGVVLAFAAVAVAFWPRTPRSQAEVDDHAGHSNHRTSESREEARPRVGFIALCGSLLLFTAVCVTIGIKERLLLNGSGSLFAAATSGDANRLRRVLDNGADVNEIGANGATALHIAVANMDIETTRILLAGGARFDIPGGDGHTALETALLGALGPDFLTSARASKTRRPTDASVRVMRELMEAFQRDSHEKVDLQGRLSVTVAFSRIGPDGNHLFPKVTFVSGLREYEIRLSSWETEYMGINLPEVGSPSSISLTPGGLYRIRGLEMFGKIDVTLLEFRGSRGGRGSISIPLNGWLPSTHSAMREHTWFGRF